MSDSGHDSLFVPCEPGSINIGRRIRRNFERPNGDTASANEGPSFTSQNSLAQMSATQMTLAQGEQRAPRPQEARASQVPAVENQSPHASRGSTNGQTQQSPQARPHVRGCPQTASVQSIRDATGQRQNSKRKASDQEIVEIPSDGEETTAPQRGPKMRNRNRGHPQVTFRMDGTTMLKSRALQFFRDEASAIFHRQANETLNDGHEQQLNDSGTTVASSSTSKGAILQAYTKLWKGQLTRSYNAQKKHFSLVEPALNQLKWEWEEKIYQENILNPLMEKMNQAGRDILRMEALVDFLRINLD